MSQAEVSGPDLQMMAFRGPELARLLRFHGVSPEQGSPLAGRLPDPEGTSPLIPAAVPEEAREAATRVARPGRVVAMAVGAPPEPAEHFWFYGKSGELDFAYYKADPDDLHHLAWPVDGVAMLDIATAPLELSRGSEPTSLSLAAGPEEFCTLCAVADFLRQETLRSLMTPVPPPTAPPSFGIEDLERAAARAGSFSDLGWSVPRARILSPVPLDFGVETLATGVASLRESGLLLPDGERSEPSALLQSLCLQFGTCQGFTALSNWRQDLERGGWSLEHFALSRGPGSLLLLEFQEVTEAGFLVALDDVTPELAFHWLQGALPIPEAGPWTEEPELPVGGGEAAVGSGAHGAGSGPPGPSVYREGATRPPPPSTRYCTGCGKPLEGGKRFCTACGAPAKEVGIHG